MLIKCHFTFEVSIFWIAELCYRIRVYMNICDESITFGHLPLPIRALCGCIFNCVLSTAQAALCLQHKPYGNRIPMIDFYTNSYATEWTERMTEINFSAKANFIWSIADLLRGP